MKWCKLKIYNVSLAVLCLAIFFGVSSVAQAQLAYDTGDEPPTLDDLRTIEKTDSPMNKDQKSKDKLDNVVSQEKDLALKIRRDSMRNAARSYGARGGLGWRTKQIMNELKRSSSAMDKSFNFRRLLIKAPTNMYIEPPIISEALNNFIVTPSGTEAAVADIVYQITNQSRIVSAPRNWQQYLERDWEVVAPPPDILLPESPQEREAWIRWVTEGWEQGIKQADEIFQSDLDLLVADFEGMVRYRRLLAEGKVTAPYATLVDRGVTSSEVQANIGNRSLNITTQLRVGDRAVRITEPASLREGRQGTEWNTATETAP